VHCKAPKDQKIAGFNITVNPIRFRRCLHAPLVRVSDFRVKKMNQEFLEYETEMKITLLRISVFYIS